MPQKYPRPPIIEAILQVRYVEGFSVSELNRLPRLLEPQYPKLKPEADYELNFEFKAGQAAQSPAPKEVDRGSRLLSHSDQKLVVARKKHVTFSFLAPYQGWDEFLQSARFVFDIIRSKIGVKPVQGIGLRYVNRLDIPIGSEGAQIISRDYMSAGVAVPAMAITSSMRGFQAIAEIELSHDKLVARVITATAIPALINHASLLLDIDIIAEQGVPQKEAEFWALIERMRDAKNVIFEGCVTDRARALFQ